MSTTSRFVGPSSSLVRALANTVVSAASETAKVLEIFEKNARTFDVPESHRKEAAKILTDLSAKKQTTAKDTVIAGLSVCLDMDFSENPREETLPSKMKKILQDLKPGFFVGKLNHNETDYLIISTGTITDRSLTSLAKPYQWNARKEGGGKTLSSDQFTHRESLIKEGDCMIYLYAIPFSVADNNTYYMWLTKEGKDIKRVRFKTSDGQIQMI